MGSWWWQGLFRTYALLNCFNYIFFNFKIALPHLLPHLGSWVPILDRRERCKPHSNAKGDPSGETRNPGGYLACRDLLTDPGQRIRDTHF